MLSIASVTSGTPASTVALPVQVAVEADRVSTRLTPVAVSAPLAGEQVADDARQGSASLSTTPQEVQTSRADSAPPPVGDSPQYLTQLLSQDGDQQTLGRFSHFAPALQYNRLVSYSFIKYKPSNAGLTSALSDGGTTALSSSNHAATVSQAYNDTQTRALSELASFSSVNMLEG